MKTLLVGIVATEVTSNANIRRQTLRIVHIDKKYLLIQPFLSTKLQINSTRQKKEEAADSSALSGEQRHIKCKDTFLDILNGAISESLEPIPRFYFVSPTRVLFVWVMDRELQGSY